MNHLEISHLRGIDLPPVLIETGTLYGGTMVALSPFFKELHTIEINPKNFEIAVQKTRELSNVHLHLGDSGLILKEIVAKIPEDILYYLDAHYIGETMGQVECPIFDELRYIVQRPNSDIIIIDDVKCFRKTGSCDYNSINFQWNWLEIGEDTILACLGDRVKKWNIHDDKMFIWI